MKKLFTLAAVACIVLAGCAKNHNPGSQSESSNKINFNSPVISPATKANVVGEISGTTYPTDETFHVYGVYTTTDFATWAAGTNFMDVDVAYTAATPKAYWAPATDYFWPKQGKLTFAAYSPARAKDNGTISYSGVGLSITGFTQPADQYDLMYSTRTYNKTESTGGTTYAGVDINFKHALSSIQFKAKTAAEYTAIIKIKKITLKNINSKADFKETITNEASYAATPKWENHSTPAEFTAFNGTFTVTKDLTALDGQTGQKDLMLIPLTGHPDEAVINVEYSIQNNASAPEIAQTQTVKIKDLTANWEIGKRYIYTINVTLNKIYFSPEVTDWTNENVSGAIEM